MAIGGAQAADLPVKAKAVEYVRICSLYGAGFFYIPGTDTCIKIGGYLRADITFNGGAHGAAGLERRSRSAEPLSRLFRLPLAHGADDRYPHRDRIRRGPHLRSGQLPVQQFRQLAIPVSNTSVSTFRRFHGLGRRQQSQLLNTAGGGYVAVEYLFIQFAGFTFGKSASAYSTPWQGFPGNINSNLLGGNNTDTGVNNIQYTAQFGNGVSATIGLDDPTVWNRTAVYNLSVSWRSNANGTGSNVYAGMHAPDVVGKIRVDQAWGLFQISAAAHEVNGSYNSLGLSGLPPASACSVPTGLSEISGHPDTKWGGSVMAALQIKNLPTGAGDDIKIDVSYAKGATKIRDRHQRHLAELCDVRRQRLPAPIRASASARPPTRSICRSPMAATAALHLTEA